MCCITGGRFLAHALICPPPSWFQTRLPTTGHQMIFSWGKWPECKDDRSPRSSVDAKNVRRRASNKLPPSDSSTGKTSLLFILCYDSLISPSEITGKFLAYANSESILQNGIAQSV
jgi:hypothetical protein